MLADLANAKHDRDQHDGEDPPERAHDVAEVHHEPGGRRQVDAESGKQVGEDGDHKLKQRAYNQHCDTDDRYRIDQRRLHRLAQLHGFFHVRREALQDGIENTARLARLDHVGSEVIENFRISAHGVRERRAALHRGAHARERLLERGIVLVGSKDLQALHQRQAGINHHRELAEEDGDLLGGDLAGTEGGQYEFLALLLDRVGGNALARQRRLQYLLVFRYALAGYFLACRAGTRECKNWHGRTSLHGLSGPRLLLNASALLRLRRPLSR